MKAKRVYTKVDITKLSAKELKAHKKRLASVRQYTRDRREYQKRINAGKLDPKITLQQFRGAKYGHSKAVEKKANVEAAKNAINLGDDVSDKLMRLLNEISRVESKKRAIADLLEKVGM